MKIGQLVIQKEPGSPIDSLGCRPSKTGPVARGYCVPKSKVYWATSSSGSQLTLPHRFLTVLQSTYSMNQAGLPPPVLASASSGCTDHPQANPGLSKVTTPPVMLPSESDRATAEWVLDAAAAALHAGRSKTDPEKKKSNAMRRRREFFFSFLSCDLSLQAGDGLDVRGWRALRKGGD